MAELVDDYIKLARKLIDDFTPNDPATRTQLWSFLQEKGSSKSRSHKNKRPYSHLLEGGFIIDRITRIERADDPHSISEKWADYSSGTISGLFKQGQTDTLTKLKEHED